MSYKEEYEVDFIVDHKIVPASEEKDRTRKYRYRIRWENYGTDEDTWEPASNLEGCKKMLREYQKQNFGRKVKNNEVLSDAEQRAWNLKKSENLALKLQNAGKPKAYIDDDDDIFTTSTQECSEVSSMEEYDQPSTSGLNTATKAAKKGPVIPNSTKEQRESMKNTKDWDDYSSQSSQDSAYSYPSSRSEVKKKKNMKEKKDDNEEEVEQNVEKNEDKEKKEKQKDDEEQNEAENNEKKKKQDKKKKKEREDEEEDDKEKKSKKNKKEKKGDNEKEVENNETEGNEKKKKHKKKKKEREDEQEKDDKEKKKGKDEQANKGMKRGLDEGEEETTAKVVKPLKLKLPKMPKSARLAKDRPKGWDVEDARPVTLHPSRLLPEVTPIPATSSKVTPIPATSSKVTPISATSSESAPSTADNMAWASRIQMESAAAATEAPTMFPFGAQAWFGLNSNVQSVTRPGGGINLATGPGGGLLSATRPTDDVGLAARSGVDVWLTTRPDGGLTSATVADRDVWANTVANSGSRAYTVPVPRILSSTVSDPRVRLPTVPNPGVPSPTVSDPQVLSSNVSDPRVLLSAVSNPRVRSPTVPNLASGGKNQKSSASEATTTINRASEGGSAQLHNPEGLGMPDFGSILGMYSTDHGVTESFASETAATGRQETQNLRPSSRKSSESRRAIRSDSTRTPDGKLKSATGSDSRGPMDNTGFRGNSGASTGFRKDSGASTGFRKDSGASTGFRKNPKTATGANGEPLASTGIWPQAASIGSRKESMASTGSGQDSAASTAFGQGSTAATGFRRNSEASAGLRQDSGSSTGFRKESTTTAGFRKNPKTATGANRENLASTGIWPQSTVPMANSTTDRAPEATNLLKRSFLNQQPASLASSDPRRPVPHQQPASLGSSDLKRPILDQQPASLASSDPRRPVSGLPGTSGARTDPRRPTAINSDPRMPTATASDPRRPRLTNSDPRYAFSMNRIQDPTSPTDNVENRPLLAATGQVAVSGNTSNEPGVVRDRVESRVIKPPPRSWTHAIPDYMKLSSPYFNPQKAATETRTAILTPRQPLKAPPLDYNAYLVELMKGMNEERNAREKAGYQRRKCTRQEVSQALEAASGLRRLVPGRGDSSEGNGPKVHGKDVGGDSRR